MCFYPVLKASNSSGTKWARSKFLDYLFHCQTDAYAG